MPHPPQLLLSVLCVDEAAAWVQRGAVDECRTGRAAPSRPSLRHRHCSAGLHSPLQSLNGTTTLRDFVLCRPELAVNDPSFLDFLMPNTFPGSQAFLGARSIMGPAFRWQSLGSVPDATLDDFGRRLGIARRAPP